ncbi:MAG: hypothetical protein ACI9FN_004056 [Saprospiraceae bacterium]|jgi:hypothetical protein
MHLKIYSVKLIVIIAITISGCAQSTTKVSIVIDERSHTESVEQIIKIDSVWAGHPVRFCLLTHEDRQYIAYYNADRSMIVGQRRLGQDKFKLHTMPRTARATSGGTSTVLGWDSHNSVTLGIDKEGYIHLAGNMHVDPITYFRTSQPYDISTLTQEMKMVGSNEQRCTYPHFMLTKDKELIFHYRDGGSGNGNEIYNIYDYNSKSWSRMLDSPLTGGQGLMNAYQSQPTLRQDGWYHVYWVWRDTPDCSTNHDLSYMKSPDLQNWFDAFGNPIQLPVTLDKKTVIVDPIPIKGGIINLAAKLCFDKENNPFFAYHKYGPKGNIQFYVSRITDGEWVAKQVTNWDYRWEFSGNGSINTEVRIKAFNYRIDGNYEIDYWHIKHGDGTILLNKDFDNIGSVLKAEALAAKLKPEGSFPGLLIKTTGDIGNSNETNLRYILKWETINANRDKPREKPWPKPSQLYLYKLSK